MNNQITQPIVNPVPLPALITNVRRTRGGYQVYSDGRWRFFAACCLSEAEKADLEDWLEEVKA